MMTTLNDYESLESGDGPRNIPEFRVSELSALLKQRIEDDFPHIRLRAEISGFKRAASGHLYFALKDEEAVLDGVCWRGTASGLAIDPEDGMEIVATGRVTTYPARSKYQMVVESMELAGEGALLRLLENRRRKLAAEGLFDEGRKQGLPFLPEVVGVVSSPTGAVIRDILHRLRDRFPSHVLLWPVSVQGAGAAEKIAEAIAGFDKLDDDDPTPRPDLLIVARGGGSLEDLMAFNEEIVVRAAAACSIPLISAVGHETDWTLIDHVADTRAPTPTAAAEMAVPVRLDLFGGIVERGRRLTAAMNRGLARHGSELAGLSRGLPNPRGRVESAQQRVDDWGERLDQGLKAGRAVREGALRRLSDGIRPPWLLIDAARRELAAETHALKTAWAGFEARVANRLDKAAGLLESYSHTRVLERGFALVRDSKGAPVLNAGEVLPGDALTVRFRDGAIDAVVSGSRAKPRAKKARPRSRDDNQGRLF